MLNVNDKKLCPNCFEEIENEPCLVCGYDTASIPAFLIALPVGTILLGKYAIGKVLGRGGFGITYLGYDLVNDKKVAIKEYLPDSLVQRNTGETLVSTFMGEKEDLFNTGAEKFYNEAKTVSRFNGHPNIINVYEFFYENNTAYFVMEYIDGVDLKIHVKQSGGKLDYQKAIEIIIPIVDALMIVHSVGILHRDISPDNIYMTTKGDVKLLDFGAARQVLGEQSKSLSVVLKQGFAPLEQYQKRGKQGPWTDIYALGATIYFLICGKVPEEVMERLEGDALETPSSMGIEISSSIEQVILKMLAVRIEDRYQSAMEAKNAMIHALCQTDNLLLDSIKEGETSLHNNKAENIYEQTAEEVMKKNDNLSKYKNANTRKANKKIAKAVGIMVIIIAILIGSYIFYDSFLAYDPPISSRYENEPSQKNDEVAKPDLPVVETPVVEEKPLVEEKPIKEPEYEVLSNGVLVKYHGDGGDIVIPEWIGAIGDYAFQGCDNLTSVKMNNKVSFIGKSAFSNCRNLKSVYISSSVITISDYAFEGCTFLDYIFMPRSVIEIGKNVFYNCFNLQMYCFDESYAEQYAIDNNIEFYDASQG